MSAPYGISDEGLRPILAPGERPLYRACAAQMPAQLWKRFTAGYFNVICSLIVTTRRFLVLRREVRWFSNELTTELLASIEHEQIARISSFGMLGKYTLTVHRTDGLRDTFELTAPFLRDPTQRAFVEEMPARFNTRQLPRE